jgi:hypothetical protein
MERVDDREGKMERYCSTGQSPQRAVAPTDEEEEVFMWFRITTRHADKKSRVLRGEEE